MSGSTCAATRADGSPCRATPGADGLCFAHSPALREKTAAARRQGGENRSNAARAVARAPRDVRDLLKTLLGAVAEVHEGRLDPKQATAMAALAGAAVKVYATGEQDARIQALEEALEGARSSIRR